MDQIRIDELSISKILAALALGPAVMAIILVMVVIIAPLALVMGIPYYFFAKEIHHALVTRAASDSQSLIPVHNL